MARLVPSDERVIRRCTTRPGGIRRDRNRGRVGSRLERFGEVLLTLQIEITRDSQDGPVLVQVRYEGSDFLRVRFRPPQGVVRESGVSTTWSRRNVLSFDLPTLSPFFQPSVLRSRI